MLVFFRYKEAVYVQTGKRTPKVEKNELSTKPTFYHLINFYHITRYYKAYETYTFTLRTKISPKFSTK